MKKIFLLLLIFSAAAANAQDSTMAPAHHRRAPRPLRAFLGDTIVQKGMNEIGINIAPVFTTLLGAYPDNEVTWTIYYKRRLQNRLTFRAGLFARNEQYRWPDEGQDNVYYLVTDSTRIMNVLDISPAKRYQLHAGLELRSKAQRRWSGFFAFDVFGGMSFRHVALYDIRQTRESNGSWSESAMIVNGGGSPIYVHATERTWYAGGNPCVGLTYAFNSKWKLLLQTGIYFYFESGDHYTRDEFGQNLINTKRTDFNFDSPGLFNQFEIVYSF
ncbi:MAG TPA: hypothetical protein VFU15_02600 [Bacteroidia bacterium]|nr:hypothetical protein [Bacteroidia bacterium]